MPRKVVPGGDMFFQDDIQIIEAEIAHALSMPPELPIFSRDELQILYNGRVFVATTEKTPDALIKVYTKGFGLEEIETPRQQEDRYFQDNATLIDKLEADFIEKTVNGISLDNGRRLGPQIGSELIEKITQEYAPLVQPTTTPFPGKGAISRVSDGSVLNSHMKDCRKILLLDNKAYELVTIPEYLVKFEKSFEANFYKQLQKQSATATPEEVYQLLTDNSDKVHRKVLPSARNKIWHSNRSFKLLLDDTYWIPEHKGKTDSLIQTYQKLLERKVKIDAVKKYT